MMNITDNGAQCEVTVGVACENQNAKGKALTTPLTVVFHKESVKNLAALKAKIKYLQEGIDAMPPAKRSELQHDSLITEAFQSSKFEEVFKNIPEPNAEQQKAIIDADPTTIKEAAHLLIHNTATARMNAKQKAREHVARGEPTFSEEDIKAIQGDIYHTVNALNGVEGSEMMRGHIRTGVYKKHMNGDYGAGGEVTFKSAHPDVTAQFMADLVSFIDDPKAKELDPVLRSIIAHHLFVQIHPFDDGNGRTSRIIYESILNTANNAEMDMRDVVNISDGYNKGILKMIYPSIRPDSHGRVQLDRFIEATAKMLEDSVDKAIEKAGLQPLVLGVSIGGSVGGVKI
jgi:hypothetical protein